MIAAVIVAAGLLCWCSAMPAPSLAAIGWRVSGTVSGNYSNEHGWLNCVDTGQVSLREQANYSLKLRPLTTSRYVRRANFAAAVRISHSGSWRLTGSYPPREPGDSTCGAPVSVDCSGGIVPDTMSEDQARNPRGTLVLTPRGKSLEGQFVRFIGAAEDAVITPRSDQPICGLENPQSGLSPLFGIGTTDMGNDAHFAKIRFKSSRLLRRRAFTLTMPASRPNGCEGGRYEPCSESGSAQMSLTFTPVRR